MPMRYLILVICLSFEWYIPDSSSWPGPQGDRNKSSETVYFLQCQTMFPMLELGENDSPRLPASSNANAALKVCGGSREVPVRLLWRKVTATSSLTAH